MCTARRLAGSFNDLQGPDAESVADLYQEVLGHAVRQYTSRWAGFNEEGRRKREMSNIKPAGTVDLVSPLGPLS
ncbi:hypothetical protein L917_07267 [Phytophthora nicotianae]|uniref:Uncharacterized protein n=1 Tax=Phytophthora nicotianae TaxID=4792 RepID=W2LBL4_PHYNI|nr:hypothetical protein L917_07267 [Phytophthora nicotianae]